MGLMRAGGMFDQARPFGDLPGQFQFRGCVIEVGTRGFDQQRGSDQLQGVLIGCGILRRRLQARLEHALQSPEHGYPLS